MALAVAQNVLQTPLRTPQGQPTTLQQLKGDKPYAVLVFWATWCGPCKKQLPALKRYYESWKKQGVEVIAISVDDARNAARVRATMQSMGLPFPVAIDANQQMYRRLNFRSVPYTFIIDSSGQVRWRHQGYIEGDEQKLDAQIRQIIQSR